MCIAVGLGMDLDEVDLAEDFAAFITPVAGVRRPALELAQQGVEVKTCEDGRHRRPPDGEFLESHFEQIERMASFSAGLETDDGSDDDIPIRDGLSSRRSSEDSWQGARR